MSDAPPLFTRENRYRLELTGDPNESLRKAFQFIDLAGECLLADCRWKAGPDGDPWVVHREWLERQRALKDLQLYDLDESERGSCGLVLERRRKRQESQREKAQGPADQ